MIRDKQPKLVRGIGISAFRSQMQAGSAAQADGSLSARYDYGPFGEAIRATGVMGKKNPIRFSTKYSDDQTRFLCYGSYRE